MRQAIIALLLLDAGPPGSSDLDLLASDPDLPVVSLTRDDDGGLALAAPPKC